jgi:hopanoid biosynthesis associated radical SAM protein HpnH
MWSVVSYVARQKLRRRKQYAVALMLEPLFQCNLACAGCGKVQYPGHILRRQLTPEQCFAAAEECGAPVVSLPGGEPLLHPRIGEIVAGLIQMGKYVYLCTNTLLLEAKLAEGVFRPSKHLTFAVHLDGPREIHDFAVCREGTYAKALQAIRVAVQRGFRVTTNTTLFDSAQPEVYRRFFDELMALGVEGLMLSPGYSYEKAPDQEHFLRRQRSAELFRQVIGKGRKSWRFNQSPLFLDFLMGYMDFECLPWGSPTYCIFGWQRPCYLVQDGYAHSFRELLEETDWTRYGRRSGNEKCRNCLMHCGYEPSSVDYTFGSLSGLARTAFSLLTGRPLGSLEKPLFVPTVRPARQGDAVASPAGRPSQGGPRSPSPYPLPPGERI